MRTQTKSNSRTAIRVATMIAVLTVLAFPMPVAAKRAAFFCEVAPGDSYVRLRGGTETVRVEYGWGDADGNVIAHRTVIPRAHAGFRRAEPTPVGAADFSVAYYNAAGVAYAVGGMVCQ